MDRKKGAVPLGLPRFLMRATELNGGYFFALLSQLLQCRLESVHFFTLFFNNVCWRAANKVFITELAFHAIEVCLRFLYGFIKARKFRVLIDEPRHWYVQLNSPDQSCGACRRFFASRQKA